MTVGLSSKGAGAGCKRKGGVFGYLAVHPVGSSPTSPNQPLTSGA